MELKDFTFLILILLPLFCQAQEQNATYKLFKDGENYERPIVYLLEDSFEETYEEGGKVYLLNKKGRFVHNPDIHSSVEVNVQHPSVTARKVSRSRGSEKISENKRYS